MKPEPDKQQFRHRIQMEVTMDSTPENLYNLVTDIKNLDRFFPEMQFKVNGDTPLDVGGLYYTRPKGSKNWSCYKITVLDKNKVVSARLVGKDAVFSALQYTHSFAQTDKGTVSKETIDYSFLGGPIGPVLNFLLGRKLVKKQVMSAHQNLKAFVENP